MEAAVTTVVRLLAFDDEGEPLPPLQFQAPTHQRSYVWTEKKQWKPLWEDVTRIAQQHLDARASDGEADLRDPEPHFLGTIIVAQTASAPSGVVRYFIVDGQQRLTTLLLLLNAATDAVREPHRLSAGYLDQVVRNQGIAMSSDEHYKVRPTTADVRAFSKAMDMAPQVEVTTASDPLQQARRYFELQAREWLTSDTVAHAEERAKSLAWALQSGLQFVVVTLGGRDNTHRVFESMNARGEPLLAYDLVKNHMLLMAMDAGLPEDELHRQHLRWFDEEQDWRVREQVGSQRTSRLDAFLHCWLQLRCERTLTHNENYDAYLGSVSGTDVRIEQVMEEMRHYGEIYFNMVRAGSTLHEEFEILFYRLRECEIGFHAFASLLLWLFSERQRGRIDDDELKRTLRMLESVLVRRMLLRKDTRQNANVAVEILRAMKAASAEAPSDVLRRELLHGRYSMQFEMVRCQEIVEQLVYNRHGINVRKRLRMVLEAVEDHYRASISQEPQPCPRGFPVTVVMPLDAAWDYPRRLHRTVETLYPDPEDARSMLVGSIGNQTLVRRRMPPDVTDASWIDRRDALNDLGVMQFDAALWEQPDFDDNDIIERSERIVKAICEIWPHPSGDDDGAIEFDD